MNKLIVSPSPHIHSDDSVKRNMYGVIIALMPAFAGAIWFFGLGALIVTVVSVAACILFEYLIQRFMLKTKTTISDGSAAITGILLAFNLPSNIPLWIVVVGAAVAIGIGKMTFGGLGNNPFNPALVGRVFLLISFPVQMTSWPKPIISRWNIETLFSGSDYSQEYIDGFTGATPLGVFKGGSGEIPSSLEMLMGNMGGSMGEIMAVALLLGLGYMLIRKIITWHIPVSVILTTAIFTGLLWIFNPETTQTPVFHLLTGGLLLGAIFMATDYATSPMAKIGMIIYGVGIGVITVLIRVYGAYPEGVSFAILIMNAFTPLINKYVKPKKFS